MTKKKLRKTAVIALTGIMMAQVAFTGCGKKEVDYSVDGTQAETSGDEKSSSRDGIAGKLGIPESCNETINAGNSGISSIVINDPDIQVPDTDKMNVEHFTASGVNSTEKQRIAEAIFEKDKGIYEFDQEKMTKGDIETQIGYYKAMIEAGQGDGNDSMVTYLESEIKNLEEEMATAPDSYPEAGDYQGDMFVGTVGDNEFLLGIVDCNDNEDATGLGTYAYFGPKMDYMHLRPYEGALMAYCSDYDDMGTGVSANVSKMTKEEAEEIAEKFMADIGIKGMVNEQTTDLIWEYLGSSGMPIASESDGYIVSYSRGISNTPTYTDDLYNVDNLQTNNGYLEAPSESYNIYVYDGQVITAQWSQISPEAESVEENVELLSYDQMLEKANTEISKYYEKYTTRYKNIEFNDLRLTYYVVPDGENKYKYIPVWVFATYPDLQDSAGANRPEQLVIMNAMDGSIIDIIEDAKTMGCYEEF
ncbi:MAG: DUF6034 family protein [Coprococcus sp.]